VRARLPRRHLSPFETTILALVVIAVRRLGSQLIPVLSMENYYEHDDFGLPSHTKTVAHLLCANYTEGI
jgi:hypothetical protein